MNILVVFALIIGTGYYLGYYDFQGLIIVAIAGIVGGGLGEWTANLIFKQKKQTD